MQNNQKSAELIQQIGMALNPHSPYRNQLMFLQCLLGSLFVRGYRTFSKQMAKTCVVLIRKHNFKSQYLYLKLVENQQMSHSEGQDVNWCIQQIDCMKNMPQIKLKVILCHCDSLSYVQLDKEEWILFQQKKQDQKGIISVQNTINRVQWGQPIEEAEDKMIIMTREQLSKLVDIVWAYIDTFGAKHKNNMYVDLQKRNPTSYNIQKLISTVNWIIYAETVGYPCNQIETANWTCFESKVKGNFQCDRKDIVMTGSGRVKMVHLLLLDSLDNYSRMEKKEVTELLLDCRKNYRSGLIRAYQISDQLQTNNLIYQVHSHTLQEF